MYFDRKVSLAFVDAESKTYNFSVKSSSGTNSYKVVWSNVGTDEIEATCTCPDGPGCKHMVAAAYMLNDMTTGSGIALAGKVKPASQLDTTSSAASARVNKPARMSGKPFTMTLAKFDFASLAALSSQGTVDASAKPLKEISYVKQFRSEVAAFLKLEENRYGYTIAPQRFVKFRFDGGAFTAICDCDKSAPNGICEHKLALFRHLTSEVGVKSLASLPTKEEAFMQLAAKFGVASAEEASDYVSLVDDEYSFQISARDKALVLYQDQEPTLTDVISQKAWWLEKTDDNAEGRKKQQKLGWVLDIDQQGSVSVHPGLFTVLKNGTYSDKVKDVLLNDLFGHFLELTDGQQQIVRCYNKLMEAATGVAMPDRQLILAELQLELLHLIMNHDELHLAERTKSQSFVLQSRIEPAPVAAAVKFKLSRTKSFLQLKLYGLTADDSWTAAERLTFVNLCGYLDGHQLYLFNNKEHLTNLADIIKRGGVLKTPLNAPVGQFVNQFVTPYSLRYQVELVGLKEPTASKLLEPVQACLYLRDNAAGQLELIPVFKYRFQDFEAEFAAGGSGQVVHFDQNQVVTSYRNSNWEEQLLGVLTDLHPTFELQQAEAGLSLSFKEALQGGWFSALAHRAEQAGWVLLGAQQLQHFKFTLEKPKFAATVSSGIDWFDLNLVLEFGKEKVSFKRIKQAILNNQNYVVLSDGSFGMLPEEWVRQFAPLMRVGREDKTTGLRLTKAQLPLLADSNLSLPSQTRDWLHALERLANQQDIPEFDPPLGDEFELRPYQQQGYNWLSFHHEMGTGALLADDMGLGKTLQMLALIAANVEAYPDARHLVVVPTSLLFNWDREARRFFPQLEVGYYYGPGRNPQKAETHFKGKNLILTTYGTVRSDIGTLADYQFDAVILDESQAIKNPDAAVSKAVKQLKAPHRYAMSGTPVENRPSDVYSQLEFLNPGLLGTHEQFRTAYATAIERNNDRERAKELQKLIKPFILRRTKEQVAKDLPAKTEMVISTNLTREQQVVYDQVRTEIRAEILKVMQEAGRTQANFLLLTGLTKLRQICASAALIKPEMAFLPDHSAKLDLLLTELESLVTTHKVLVFSNFIQMLKLVQDALTARNIQTCYLDGQTRKREAVVDEFVNDEAKRVFLLTLKVGGVGLNLTQADYVFLLDPWWNPAVEAQAIDRTYRIGQTMPVFAFRMVAVGTIEEKILALQERKKQYADDLINTDEALISQLSDQEMLKLLD